MTEATSTQIASIAARGLRDPASLTPEEIKAVCGSALTQRESEAPFVDDVDPDSRNEA